MSINWQDLHNDSVVVDLHSHPAIKAHILHRNLGSKKKKFLAKLFERGFWPLSDRASFPLVMQGGVDVLLSTVYTPEGGWFKDMKLAKWLLNIDGWLRPFTSPSLKDVLYREPYFDSVMSALDDIERQVEEWNKLDEGDRKIQVCKRPEDILGAIQENSLSLVHSVEGAHSLQTSCAQDYPDDVHIGQLEHELVLQNLETLNNRGVAYLTLAHFYPNTCVYPVFPWPEYAFSHGSWRNLIGRWDETKGLTATGEAVVKKMLDLGMLIDVSHCTLAARKRIYDIVDHYDKKQCLMATHVGAFEVNPVTYNFQDWEFKWMADRGCVAGIIFMNYWLAPTDTGLGLKYIEQTLRHIINIAGEDCVGLGTDFDGFTDPPDEVIDFSQLPRVTQYLKSLDYSDTTVEKFLGRNALSLLLEGWKGVPAG